MARLAAIWICCLPLLGAGAALGAAGPYEDQPIGQGKGVVLPSGTSHTENTPASGGVWWPVVMSLAAVVGLILVARPVLARMNFGRGGNTTRAIEVMGSHVIGPRQRVLLLRVGKRLILVGHSSAGMNTLCEIQDPDEVASLLGQLAAQSSAAARPFSAAMNWARGRSDEVTAESTQTPAPSDEAAVAATREELGGLMDKVRQLSKQYQRTP